VFTAWASLPDPLPHTLAVAVSSIDWLLPRQGYGGEGTRNGRRDLKSAVERQQLSIRCSGCISGKDRPFGGEHVFRDYEWTAVFLATHFIHAENSQHLQQLVRLE
jgi:hypothetical protein